MVLLRIMPDLQSCGEDAGGGRPSHESNLLPNAFSLKWVSEVHLHPVFLTDASFASTEFNPGLSPGAANGGQNHLSKVRHLVSSNRARQKPQPTSEKLARGGG